MISPTLRRALGRAVAAICCLAALGGCASWNGPRIDPSGERLLVWPGDPPPTIVGPPTAVGPPTTVVTPAPGAATVTAPPPGAMVIPSLPPIAPATGIGAPMGNMQAPPVYSDPTPVSPPAAPGFPYAPNVVAPMGAAPVGGAAVPVSPPLPLTTMRPAGVPGIVTPLGGCAPAGAPYLRLTPNGIMAPVGSEVVLKAGIADCDGALLANRRVEWGISGVGQFTELGAPYQVGYFNLPWTLPRRIAANYAVGPTALTDSTLYTGTPDPNDDVPIARGEAWVTITSPCEGTSLVTAYTPSLERYNRVTTTVYWVDAQFIFPPPATAEPGRPHVLTTTVIRRSDNSPQAGWTVRYVVASGASLGYEGGNTVEAQTDANGRASVEVSPVDVGGGTTTVGIAVYRPAVGGAPPLGVAQGNTTITWGAGAAPGAPAVPSGPGSPPSGPPLITPSPGTAPYPSDPYTPSPYTPSAPSQPMSPYTPGQSPPSSAPTGTNPPPSLPNNTSSPPPQRDPYTPPAATGRPQLQVQVGPASIEQVAVGENARFEVFVTNTGDGIAKDVVVKSAFDPGLAHAGDTRNAHSIDYDKFDLAPGKTQTVPLTFQVTAPGTHCQTVTVSSGGITTAPQRTCVTAAAADLRLNVTAPRSAQEGELAPIRIVLVNGASAVRNVELVVRVAPQLDAEQISDPSHDRVSADTIALHVGDVAAGERREFMIGARCKTRTENACVRAELTADGASPLVAEDCVEILPPAPAESGGIFGP